MSFAGAAAISAGYSFLGIWAIRELHASSSALGTTFLVGAILAAGAGYLGGHASDRAGRRPLILLGWAGHVAFWLALVAVGSGNVLRGLAVASLAGVFGSLGGAADQAMVADLVPPERHEAAYAAVRVASNLGVTVGPPLGGLFVALGGWDALFGSVAAMAAVAFVLALLFLPQRGAYASSTPPERGSFGAIRRDRPFLVFLVSAAAAWLVYVAYDSVLPISLVATHGFSPATWGLLAVVNPVLVTLFQLRVTAAATRFPAPSKLAVAMLLMGLPFLLLTATAAVPVVVLVLVLFVAGEMLWVPTSQGIAAALAPEDIRGAYMGAFSGMSAVGFALAPFLGLQLRGAAGDSAMWLFFAGLGVVAAATGAAAAAGVSRRRERATPRSSAPLPPR